MLYVTEARRCDSSWTIEDIPRTSYSSKTRPDGDKLRVYLYHCAFNLYTELKNILPLMFACSEEMSHEREVESQLIALLPVGFEALMYMEADNNWNSNLKESISLTEMIDSAAKMEAPPKTYALLADLILSAAQPQNEAPQGKIAQIPLPLAINLLSKIIQAMRSQPDYDVERAARWIRCVVQLVLDRQPRHEESKDIEREAKEHSQCLDVVYNIINEALVLAADAVNSAGKDKAAQVYPSDELHWLVTMLFNLGVERWVAEREGEARKWTEKAVEVADAMGRNPGVFGGDGGALGRGLRGKRGRMGFK
jgi:hypothetical protein